MPQVTAEERARAKALLVRFLPRAMADGVLDEVEKLHLHAILTSGVLTKDDVQEVFRNYLLQVHQEITADGKLTLAEVVRLRTVITELRIPQSFLPPEIALIVGG
jgi:hypothetical protein